MIELLVIAAGVAILYESGMLSSIGLAPTPSLVSQGLDSPTAAQQRQQALISQQNLNLAQPGTPAGISKAGLAVQGAAQIGGGAVAGSTALANTSIAGVSGAALGAITAGIGVAVTIFAVLWSRHQMRAKQAKDENSSVNLGVSGFDSDVQVINQQYNAGNIDLQTALKAVQQAYAQFWAITTPHIQPGRNGCTGGSSCAGMIATAKTGKQSCTGDKGAACCIGCVPLYYSLYDPGNWTGASPQGPGIVTVLMAGGGVSTCKTIGASSYGTKARTGYT